MSQRFHTFRQLSTSSEFVLLDDVLERPDNCEYTGIPVYRKEIDLSDETTARRLWDNEMVRIDRDTKVVQIYSLRAHTAF